MGRFDRLPGIDDSHSRRRNVVIGTAYALAGCVGVSALAGDPEDDTDADATGNGNGNGNGAAGGGETQTDAPTQDATDTETDPETDPETDTEDPTPESPDPVGEMSAVSNNTGWLEDSTTFQDSGQVVTDVFAASRFTAFVFEHDGSSNFIVELIDDESGDTVDVLVNEIGSVRGATGTALPDGEYILDVDADGEWSIELGEPYAPENEYGVPPGSLSGEFNDVFGEIEMDGRYTVSGEHSGDGNFQVIAWDEANTSGFPNAVIFNEIGQFSGETSVQLSGLFYIEVVGNGDYSVEIEE